MLKKTHLTLPQTLPAWLPPALLAAALTGVYTEQALAQEQAAPAADTTKAAEEPPLLTIKRFEIEGTNPLPEARTQAVLAPYLGPQHDLASIEAAATALEKALRDEGLAFHRVIVPAQKPEGGVLKLRILSFTLSDVTVSGNRYFSRENILRSLPALRPGSVPNVRDLGSELTLANEHPAKRVAAQFKESDKPDEISAEVKVRDVPTSQTFIGLSGGSRDYDNTLNRNTGYTRLTIGHQRSNLFDRDQALTLAYTTSPEELSKVSQYGVFYWIPLYGYNTSINLYWTKSDIDTGTVGVGGVNFQVSGRGEFYGIRATYSLPKIQSVSQSVALSVDSRYFENNIGFSGASLPTTSVGSMPGTVRYALKTEQTWGGVGGALEYVTNLGGGRADSDNDYATARALAGRRWEALRWEFQSQYNFVNRWSLSARALGQYTRDALIPGEQFGVGGVASVRGLRERETTGDRGYTATLELAAPPQYGGVVPFGFADFGARSYVIPVTAVTQSDHVATSGLGVRWNWEKGLDVNVTYAYVINGTGNGAPGITGTPSGQSKLNFTLFYRF